MKKVYFFKLIIFLSAIINSLPTNSQIFNEQTEIELTGVGIGSTAWGDYDNDGDLDILLTGSTASNCVSKIYRNNGNNTFTEQTGITLEEVTRSSVAWGDYDNDNYLDILLTGWANSGSIISKIYRNNGDYTFSEQTDISLTGVRNSSVAWGDYDNDGDLDILLTGHTGSTKVSLIYRNNGDNIFSEQTSISLTGVSSGSVAWGDYDNDGYLDILLTGEASSGEVSKIYRNNGNNTFSEQTGISLIGVSSSSVAWGDYDIDGDLDILLTGVNNRESTSKIYRNNGNNRFFEQTGIYIPDVMSSSAVWGDYDNDGYLDILVSGDDYVYTPYAGIFRNNGNNTFSFAFSLTGVSSSSVVWGDYDNDGDLDIILTGIIGYSHYGVVSKIYRNDLAIHNTKPSSPTNLRDTIINNNIFLTWDKSTDNETPQEALSYNIYISSVGNEGNIKNSMSNVSTGFMKIVYAGNVGQSNSYTIYNLSQDQIYHWSVQAIDAGFTGGEFAPEQSFAIGKANQIIIVDTISRVTPGDTSFLIMAKASSGLPVSITNSNISVAFINNNLITIKNKGTTTINLSQAGDDSYNAAPEINMALTVTGDNKDTIILIYGNDTTTFIKSEMSNNYETCLTEISCDRFVSPSGKYIWTSRGIYSDTIPNHLGTDSIIIFNLTINESSNSSININTCNSYISPSGKYIWTNNGTFYDTISNAAGCDSIITINLQIYHSENTNITASACDYYVSPGGKYFWTESGEYHDTITGDFGCKSLITVNLTINKSSDTTMSVLACKRYISPGGKILTTSGIFIDTIPNAVGCDSIIKTILFINEINTTVTKNGRVLVAGSDYADYQWLNCSDNYSVINGETSQSYWAQQNGTYAVELTMDECIDTSDCFNITLLNFIENTFEKDIIVFPNPTEGKINIILDKIYHNISVQVAGIDGELYTPINFKEAIELNFEIIGLNGFYIINIDAEEGKTAKIKILKN